MFLLVPALMFGPSVFAGADADQGSIASGGMLKKRIEERQNLISVVLIGATRYDITELFNEILKKTPGVLEAKRLRFYLDPNKPRACRVDWQVMVEDMSPFELERAVYSTIQDIAEMETAQHLPFKMTPEHQKLMGNIRPLVASEREIQFHFLQLEPKHAKRPIRWYLRGQHWPDTGFE
ncbi:MAG: hypothetical protein JRJ04_17060 [Deltaproteobacteria bacterium]|nr:hypothetical protein [Deltaproteobacteria bacterium]